MKCPRPPRLPSTFLPSARRRGYLLLVGVTLIPLALGLLLVLMSRMEVLHAETRREEARAQAALLAESAVAALASGALEEGSGDIDNAGPWRLRREAPGRWIAEGRVALGEASFVCALGVERATTGALRLTSRRQSVEMPPPSSDR